MSMLITLHGAWLMYFTSEGKPPSRGLVRPVPKRPSMTTVWAVRSGGSNSLVTSVKFLMSYQGVVLLIPLKLLKEEREPVLVNAKVEIILDVVFQEVDLHGILTKVNTQILFAQ